MYTFFFTITDVTKRERCAVEIHLTQSMYQGPLIRTGCGTGLANGFEVAVIIIVIKGIELSFAGIQFLRFLR